MAEKRGQYQYNDDGSVSQLVHNTNETAENSMISMDKQAQLKQQIESNTTPLGVSATYTGASFDTMTDGINFNSLTGLVRSDQSGTLNIQQSPDGVAWVTSHILSITANVTVPIDHTVLLRHVRLQVINGAVAQTNLSLYGYVTFK